MHSVPSFYQFVNPLISIIVVTYNVENSIKATLQNILDQSYKNIELIIIDGGSSDGTTEIIKNYLSYLHYFISEKDNGIYDAMNKGISRAKGDWVIFMNSGDIFAGNSVLEDVFRNKEIDAGVGVLYGNTVIKDSGNVVIPPALINKDYFFFETICHQSVFFRRTAFEATGYFNIEYKILADRVWLLKACLQNIEFRRIPVDICIWDRIGFSSDNIALYVKESRSLQKSYFHRSERMKLLWEARIKNLNTRIFRKYKR